MKRLLYIFFVIFFIVSLSGCALINKFTGSKKSTQYLYLTTAQKWFSLIEQKAKKWRPDAVFYGIAETEVTMEGESGIWEYFYDSPTAEKQAIVKLEGGFISLREESRTVLTRVKMWTIDSSAAMQYANASGGKSFLEQHPKARIFISLLTELPTNRSKQTIWFVKYQEAASLLFMFIDAQTGTLIWKKQVTY